MIAFCMKFWVVTKVLNWPIFMYGLDQLCLILWNTEHFFSRKNWPFTSCLMTIILSCCRAGLVIVFELNSVSWHYWFSLFQYAVSAYCHGNTDAGCWRRHGQHGVLELYFRKRLSLPWRFKGVTNQSVFMLFLYLYCLTCIWLVYLRAHLHHSKSAGKDQVVMEILGKSGHVTLLVFPAVRFSWPLSEG